MEKTQKFEDRSQTCGLCGNKFVPFNPEVQFCKVRRLWWCDKCWSALSMMPREIARIFGDIAVRITALERRK